MNFLFAKMEETIKLIHWKRLFAFLWKVNVLHAISSKGLLVIAINSFREDDDSMIKEEY